MTTPRQNPPWKLQGQLLGACDCTVACSCAWLRPPSLGRARLLIAWHIVSGHLDRLRLDRLNVAMACEGFGDRHDRKWQAALYLDKRADPQQRTALQQIFSGRHGSHPAMLMTHICEIIAIRHPGIEFVDHDTNAELHIQGVARAEIEGVRTLNGKPSSISNPPLCAGSRYPSTLIVTRCLSYHDLNRHWETSQGNGYYAPFVYQP